MLARGKKTTPPGEFRWFFGPLGKISILSSLDGHHGIRNVSHSLLNFDCLSGQAASATVQASMQPQKAFAAAAVRFSTPNLPKICSKFLYVRPH